MRTARFTTVGTEPSLTTGMGTDIVSTEKTAADATASSTVVAGIDLGGTNVKTAIVGRAISELQAAGADTSLAVMIGDRIYDVEGAAAHDIPSIIVEWGYGSPEEAKDAMATVYSADQLRELLLG